MELEKTSGFMNTYETALIEGSAFWGDLFKLAGYINLTHSVS